MAEGKQAHRDARCVSAHVSAESVAVNREFVTVFGRAHVEPAVAQFEEMPHATVIGRAELRQEVVDAAFDGEHVHAEVPWQRSNAGVFRNGPGFNALDGRCGSVHGCSPSSRAGLPASRRSRRAEGSRIVRPPQAASASALVLDAEHGVTGCALQKSRPPVSEALRQTCAGIHPNGGQARSGRRTCAAR